ncbi:hypothetical protein HDU67_009953 [Dinochytrium kinnereticum]|nr:hypothetical protein HDU67_009953 [Dinochytrium kinnereticum]
MTSAVLTLSPNGYRFPAGGVNTLEAYYDYTCPFSKRSFMRIVKEVIPYAEATYPGKLSFVFRHQVQPWHPQSTLLHEAAIAVHRISPEKFIPFSAALFEASETYYDDATYERSRIDIYSDLAKLAEASVEVPAKQVLGLLERRVVEGEHNTGNQVTNVLKLHIKMARYQGVHVSPTVLYNGLVDDSVSSGWDLERWKVWLAERLA